MRTDQGQRLRHARTAAGYRSARSAALANGWPESTYRTHEGGARTIGQDDAEKYAAAFRGCGVKVSAVDILFGSTTASGPTDKAHTPRLDATESLKIAKLTDHGQRQSLVLPDEFRFHAEEIFIHRDTVTGDVVLSERRPEWKRFFALLEQGETDNDFLKPEDRDQGAQDRDPLDGVEG